MDTKIKYYLYIKTSPKGLKYLGKTTKDPNYYLGSGKIWKRHLKKHNLTIKDILTEIVFETYDETELILKGIELSKLYDVVKSKEWANLIEESGDGGNTSKFINYNQPIYHSANRSKHLNLFKNEEEKKKIITERTAKIDYKDPERIKKIKENTDWETWNKSIQNRNTDYSTFLSKVHESNKKPILQLDLNDNIIAEFESTIDASNISKVKCGNISQVLTGRNKTAGGYKWKYKIEENESK